MIHLVTGSGAESHEYKEWDVVTSFCSAEQQAGFSAILLRKNSTLLSY